MLSEASGSQAFEQSKKALEAAVKKDAKKKLQAAAAAAKAKAQGKPLPKKGSKKQSAKSKAKAAVRKASTALGRQSKPEDTEDGIAVADADDVEKEEDEKLEEMQELENTFAVGDDMLTHLTRTCDYLLTIDSRAGQCSFDFWSLGNVSCFLLSSV